MKKITISMIALTFALLQSCGESKKLEEVVDVPLPEKESANTELGNPNDVKVDEGGTFEMIALPYAYDALEPYIDARTMEIHFSKHHLGYANKLNEAIKDTPLAEMSIEQILESVDASNGAVRNNAGGYYNHNLFWQLLKVNNGQNPEGVLLSAINRDFGSLDEFKMQFSDAAMKQFGSGWAWLMSDASGKLTIVSTPNQDNPLMKKLGGKGGSPILCVDVWEHAYYLKYQNKRKDYLENFFQVVNWSKVAELYANATKK